MGVDKIHVGVVTKEEDRYSNCNFFTFFSFSRQFYFTETIMGKTYHVTKWYVISNCFGLEFLWSSVEWPYLTNATVTAPQEYWPEESTDRNQSHNDCRSVWTPLLVIGRFYSHGQQPFLLLANNWIAANVATTRLTISHLATRALYLQLRKVTEQLSELLPISLMFFTFVLKL